MGLLIRIRAWYTRHKLDLECTKCGQTAYRIEAHRFDKVVRRLSPLPIGRYECASCGHSRLRIAPDEMGRLPSPWPILMVIVAAAAAYYLSGPGNKYLPKAPTIQPQTKSKVPH